MKYPQRQLGEIFSPTYTIGASFFEYPKRQLGVFKPTDWNLMLLTEHKDLATYKKNLEKADALLQTVIGNDEKQRQG